jgi:hypothetical protein
MAFNGSRPPADSEIHPTLSTAPTGGYHHGGSTTSSGNTNSTGHGIRAVGQLIRLGVVSDEN